MNNPPKYIMSFFRWFCHPDLVKYIEGDLMELFNERTANSDQRSAKWLFVWDVVKLFRPSIIRPVEGTYRLNHYGMIRHNMLITLRVIRKDRIYSVINTFGLALGIASFLAIFQYVTYEKSFDSFHQKKDNIYRITSSFVIEDQARRYLATTPPRLATYAAANVPEIENYTRIDDYHSAGHGDLTLSNGAKKFRESRVFFVEPAFLNIFSFSVIKGDKVSCLSELRTMVMTESTAKRYFGEENPIGQTLAVDGAGEPYTVTAVLQDPPKNSHLQFDLLISYKTLNWWYEGEAENHWTNHEFYSYLLLNPRSDVDVVEKKINELYVTERGEYNRSKNFEENFSLQPISEVHFTKNLESEIDNAENVNSSIIQIISLVGWFILAIAWINYINMATVRSFRRSAEVEIRKTLGAHQLQLMGLFVMESLFIHLTAFFMAIVLLVLGSPYLEDIIGFKFTMEILLRLLVDFKFFIGIAVASLFIGVYPAWVLAKLKLIYGLKSQVTAKGSKSWLLRGLVVFQFSVSIALIIGSISIYRQLEFMRAKDSGFEMYNKLVIRGPNQVDEDSDSIFQVKHKRFIDEMSKNSYVKSVTTANKVPGEAVVEPVGIRNKDGDANQEGQAFDVISVGMNFFKTFGMKLIAGRPFSMSSDIDLSVILNESAVKLLGYQIPDSMLNKTLVLNDKYDLKVIGIVKNFNQLSSGNPISPLIFYCDTDYVHYYVVSYSGRHMEVIEKSEALLAEMFPCDPFDFFFLDEHYNRQYLNEEKLGMTILLFSGLAIVIACLGLIGLASHNTTIRVKEIGIRKTFGASIESILILLNKETAWLLLIANIVTWPLMYQLMSQYLEGFASRISLGPQVFLLAGGIILALAVGSISLITFKAASANPADSLRDE
ncbi:ABC transporter permease [Reichenbachiella sp. MALMAid0571]|uniref:ABC transporter permease n=1 Tax=Reichenbachiella sp. MALMAid0571 TaxID=3143939 RepID=UPI0032DEC15A